MHQKPWLNWAVFATLAALIMGPLLGPGYVLTLDLSWGPHLGTVDPQDSRWLLHQALTGLTQILPSQVVEKLILITIFVLAGVGMQRLAGRAYPGWPAYVAGGLYVVNPFMYERLMAGQWLVLAGAAVLPWFVDALVRLLIRPGWRRALGLAGWGTALAIVSLHTVAMAALIALAVCLAHAWGRWRSMGRTAAWLSLAAGLCSAACALWLVPLLLHRSATARAVASFDANQFTAFATNPGQVGVPLNVLSLQGFWGGARGLVAPAAGTGAWFWLAFVLVAALVAVGIMVAVRHRDRPGMALAAVAVVAWVLAMGVAWPPSAVITHFLVDHVPFFRGYREPGKWIAILALAYAYLSAAGLHALAARTRGFWRAGLAVAAGLLPVLWVPLMLWGGAGQLRATDYPASWYALNQRLNTLPPSSASHADTLVLPWHQYLFLDFAHRTVANPAPLFFDRPVIISSDPELPGLTPDPGQKLAASIQNNVINRRFFEKNAGARLSGLGVHYIVLLKVSDWSSYGWLGAQSDLTLVAETPEWQLYNTQTGL